MRRILYISCLFFSFLACQSQVESKGTGVVGGPCEGCEAVFEYADKPLSSVDSLPLFLSRSPKLKISGTVYKKDGRTPAKDVIIYIYHTNRKGVYEIKKNASGWARRHGIFRGWVKTDENGYYSFYTFRPSAYPGRTEPEHIHMTVKEPHKNPYYIDDIVFSDDLKLTNSKRQSLKNRGGSGLVVLKKENNILIAQRSIILGFNIPNYE